MIRHETWHIEIEHCWLMIRVLTHEWCHVSRYDQAAFVCFCVLKFHRTHEMDDLQKRFSQLTWLCLWVQQNRSHCCSKVPVGLTLKSMSVESTRLESIPNCPHIGWRWIGRDEALNQ